MVLSSIGTIWSKSPASRIAAIYLAVTALWILVSDQVLLFFVQEPALVTRLQTYKGWFFVTLSAFLIWHLIHADYRLRRKLEDDFRRTELRYRRAFESAGQGMWMLDAQGRTQLLNHWFEEVLGWDITAAVGMPAHRWVPKIYIRSAQLMYRQALRGKASQREIQYGDNSLLVSTVPLFNREKEYDGMVIVVADISDLRLIRDNLQAALHQHSLLLHEIHHRVRNNLQLVISMLNLQSSDSNGHEVDRFIRYSEAWLKGIAAAYHLAYQGDTFDSIVLSEYIEEVVGTITSMQELNHISIHMAVPDVVISMDIAVPFGLLLSRLLFDTLITHSSLCSKISASAHVLADTIQVHLALVLIEGTSRELDFSYPDSIAEGLAAQMGGSVRIVAEESAFAVVIEFPREDV